jgi:hypothetical protein
MISLKNCVHFIVVPFIISSICFVNSIYTSRLCLRDLIVFFLLFAGGIASDAGQSIGECLLYLPCKLRRIMNSQNDVV